MPASYAHYRFGKQALSQLPPDVRQCIQRFRRMYDMGLQGPDIFFYYSPLISTATGALGAKFHQQRGQEFFPVACKAASSEAARAYLYGLLAHYCLDSVCHPFVNRLVEIEEARHIPLEAELERFLLILDGKKDPRHFDRSRLFRLTRGECMSVAALYPGATGGKVSRCVHTMSFFCKFLAHPKSKSLLLERFAPSLLEHKIPEEESPELSPYVRELHHLYGQALEQYPSMLSQLQEHTKTGAPLGDAFFPDFG